MKIRNIVAVCGIAALAVFASTACSNKAQDNDVNKESSKKSDKDSGAGESYDNTEYGKVTLGEYKGLALEVSDANVTDEEVESRIQSTVSMNPEKTAVEGRAVENGDVVNIDFEGKIDGTAFEGGTAKGYDLTIGSGSFIPGFEEQIIGMNKGETRDLNLTFPTPYDNNPDLAGKATVFTVTVNEIYKETPAEFNDAFVERVTQGQQKTTAEFRDAIKAEISKYKKESSDTEAQLAALSKVIENSTFELSDDGVNKELEDIKKQYEQMATSYGMDMKKFAELSNMTEEEFNAKLKESAENRAKQKLVIDAIFEKENMALEDADYAKLEELSGMKKNDLVLQYGQEFIDESVKSIKVEKFLTDNAVKTIKPAETTAVAPEPASEAESNAEDASAEAQSTEAAQ